MKISRFPKNPKAPSEWHMAQVSREALETCASWIRLMVGWRGWSLVKFWWVLETCLGNFAWIFLLLFGGGCLEDCWFIFNCLFWCGGGWFEIHCGCLFLFPRGILSKAISGKNVGCSFCAISTQPFQQIRWGCFFERENEFWTISTRWSHVKFTGWELAERKMGRSVGMNMLFHVKN